MNTNINAIISKIGAKSGHEVMNYDPVEEATKENYSREQNDIKALEYLKAKFPEVEEKVFFTDYIGRESEHVIDCLAVCQAAMIDKTCEVCQNGVCNLPKEFKASNSRPIVKVSENVRGFKYLDVRWTCGLACRFQPLSGEFGRMFKKSGLVESQINMTFETYECSKSTPEIRRAKMEAVMASAEQSCLIIAGKRGTGKTHLAVAIALTAMRNGKQAIFRLVNEMLDEIRQTVAERGDYYGLMKMFKTVPCLILDDLGKEKTTDAGMDYLHQIIDYRYRHNLQTIVTTNARSSEELSHWSDTEFITPIISRLEERGEWVTIENAEDFRTKKRDKEVNRNGK